MKFKLLYLIAILAATVTACSVDDNDNYCFSSGNTSITSVTGELTTTVDEPLTLTVSFRIPNSCGTFSHFTESNGYPKQVFAVLDYDGCVCSEIATVGTEEYVFTASQPGEYLLKFLSGNSAYIEKTITVTAE